MWAFIAAVLKRLSTKKVHIDNVGFQMFYRFSFGVIVLAVSVVGVRKLWGETIHCRVSVNLSKPVTELWK